MREIERERQAKDDGEKEEIFLGRFMHEAQAARSAIRNFRRISIMHRTLSRCGRFSEEGPMPIGYRDGSQVAVWELGVKGGGCALMVDAQAVLGAGSYLRM